MVQATVLHEVGHTLGLHHIFKLPGPSANSFSVMNYANDDAARWVTRIDSKTVRTEYPSRSGSLLDVAIYPLVYGNDQYAQEYATLSKSSVAPGEAFTADRWTIQNVGNQAASNVVVTFYAWPKSSGRQYPQPGDVRPRERAPSARSAVDGEAGHSAPLSVPAGTAAGEYFVGAIVTVNGARGPALGRRASPRTTASSSGTTRGPSSGSSPAAAAERRSPPTSPGPRSARSRASPSASSTPRAAARRLLLELRRRRPPAASNTSTAKNPSHTYANPGTYTVTLAVSGGGSSNQTQRSVAVAGKPTGGGTATQTLFVPIVLDVGGPGRRPLQLRADARRTAARRRRRSRLTYTGCAPPRRRRRERDGHGDARARAASSSSPTPSPTSAAKGLAIPGGGSNQGGTLRVRFEGLSSEDAGFAGVRTTTPSGQRPRRPLVPRPHALASS